MVPGGMQLSWADHLIAILITFVVPGYALLRAQPSLRHIRINERTRIGLYYANSVSLFVLAFIVAGVWVLQGRGITALGFSDVAPGMIWVYLVCIFLGLYAADVVVNTIFPTWRTKRQALWQEMTPFLPSNARELFHFSITVAFAAAVCEEIIYRGFFIQYCLALFPPNPVGEYSAILLPAMVFSVVHRYQGWIAVLKIFLLACLFGLIFVRSQSLLPVILLHYLIDLIGGLLSRHVFFPAGRSDINRPGS